MAFTLLNGLAGGFVATVAMAALMMVMGDDSPPPTAQLFAKFVGDQPASEYMMQGMALHFLYGMVAGAVFALALPALGFAGPSLVNAVVYGAVYGILLQVAGTAVWMKGVLGMEPDRQQMIGFTVFHLVYGVVLGAWLALVTL